MAMPQTQQPDKLGFALQYAALGWPVFPLHSIGPESQGCLIILLNRLAGLTNAPRLIYADTAVQPWAVGIGLLNEKRHSRDLCGFFMPIAQPPVMAGWAEQPQGWPALFPVDQLRSVRLPMIGLIRGRVLNPFPEKRS